MNILGIVASQAVSGLPVAGAALWLDGNDATTFTYSSGTVVSQWNDKSGNARHFAQSTVARQPNRNATQNSKSGITFSANNWLELTTYNWSNSAFTAFFVYKYPAPAVNFSGVFGSNVNSALALAHPNSDYYGLFKIGVLPYAYNLYPTATNADVAVWKSAGQSSGNVTVNFYQNGTAASSSLSITGLSVGTGAILGASTTAGADPIAAGTTMFEVIVYPSELSDSNRNSVESYLKTKWATP